MRTLPLAGLLLSALAALAAAPWHAPARAAEAVIVAPIALNFTWSVPHAPLRWAEETGLFKADGVAFDVVPTKGGDQALQLLAAGKVDYAFTDGDTFLAGVAAGKVDATAIYVWLDTPSLCIASMTPLSGPASLEGRSFGTTQFSTGRLLLPYILKKNGIDPAAVRIEAVDLSVLYAGFFDGEFDTVQINDPGGWQSLLALARKQGKTLALARLSDWGLTGYDKLVIVRNAVLGTAPDAVARVVKALNEADTEAIARASDDAIYAAMKDVMPQTDKAAMLADWHDFKAEAKRPGPVDPQVLASSVARLVAAGVIAKSIPVAGLYRNP